MVHQFSDQTQFRVMANLPLMRMISGSTQGMEMERGFLKGIFKYIGDDGLFYNDVKSRPWVRGDVCGVAYHYLGKDRYYTSLQQSNLLLHTLMSYGQYSGDQRWFEVARRCIDSLIRLAVDRGNIAYYHKWQYLPGEAHSEGPPLSDFVTRWVSESYFANMFLRFYDLTGYQPAADMARKLTLFNSSTWMFPDDKNLPWKNACYAGFPNMASSLPMEYGLRLDDAEMLKVAQQNFEKHLPYVDKFTGYTSEVIFTGSKASTQHTAEGCYVAYPIQNAAVLSKFGIGDNWNHIDRWVRNMFAEAQLKNIDWVSRINLDKPLPPHATTDNVLERNIGSFGGAMRPNDWYGGDVHGAHHPDVYGPGGSGMALQFCCQARSAAAIYNVWDSIIQHEDGKLKVNLLLNRASEVADIDSHIPYTGQVDVKVKQPVELSIRIPEWVKPEEASATVDGENRDITFVGRYAQLGSVNAGQKAILTFPISERDEKTVIEGREYMLRIKGNTVIGISPGGKHSPLYQRAYYRENSTRWHKVNRFLIDRDKFKIKESHALCW